MEYLVLCGVKDALKDGAPSPAPAVTHYVVGIHEGVTRVVARASADCYRRTTIYCVVLLGKDGTPVTREVLGSKHQEIVMESAYSVRTILSAVRRMLKLNPTKD